MYIRPTAAFVSLLGILVALLTLNMWVLLGFHVVLLLLCLIDVVTAVSPKKILINRDAPTFTKTNTGITETITLANPQNRRIKGSMREVWPPSAGVQPDIQDFTLPAGGKQDLSYTLTPKRRGTIFSQHLTIRTNGILQLAGRQRSFPTNWELRVLPPFKAKKHLPSRLKRLKELEGRALLLVRGQGTEFDSLREYVAGDDVRAIDWRSTARLGTTVVRTWRPERDRQVVIVLDSGRAGAMRIGKDPAFDTFIDTALLTGILVQRAGDKINLRALDTKIQGRLSSDNDPHIMHNMAQMLADVNPVLSATDWQVGYSEIRQLTKNPALIIILTTMSLTSISDGLLNVLPAMTRTHKVIIGSLQDDENALPTQIKDPNIFTNIAQSRTKIEKDAVAKELNRLGAIVVTGTQDTLPPHIADTYLNLKAQGKL